MAPDLALGDLRAVLLHQALPDPPRGMTLLARRIAVGFKPSVDQRVVLPELRSGSPPGQALGRRQRRGQRLAHRPAMNTVLDRQRSRRETLTIAIPPDLLEQFHA